MYVGVFQALPGRVGGLQEPPGASIQGPSASETLQKTRPPTMGGGSARLRRVCNGEWRGFLKGSERPEAGCLGEFTPEGVYIRLRN